MIETRCPTCGARCTAMIKLCHNDPECAEGKISPLPQPDLTKLKEALDRYRLCQKQGCLHSHTYDLAKAAQELLEQEVES